MALLELLEHLRSPFFDTLNMLFTVMGEGLFFILILCLIFWCIDKKLAYRICFIYIAAGLAVQTLKITFRIDRPFVRNSSLHPVESARKTATGYSFPSGHTQNVTSMFLTFAHISTFLSAKVFCAIPIILVMFSRMYLGVHTPYDVFGSFIVSAILTITVNYLFDNFTLHTSHRKWVLILFTFITGIIIAYAVYLNTTVTDITLENMEDIFKACGAALGFLIGWYIETSRIHFNEKAATLPYQIMKFIMGTAMVIGIKTFTSYLLSMTGLSIFLSKFIEYAILTFFISAVYPMIIKFMYTDEEQAYRH